MPQSIYSESLTEEIRQLIQEKYPRGDPQLELFELATEMGCSGNTLVAFRDGRTTTPNAHLAQALYEKLTGNKLLTAA